MRRLGTIFGLLMLCGAMSFGQAAGPTLAVLDVAGTRVEQAALNLVYGYIVDKLNRTEKYAIVERSALDKVLKELEISGSSMVDEKTVMEIGKISGAEFILVSTLSLDGDVYYLSMRVISVKSGKVERTSAKRTANLADMENLATAAVDSLFDADRRIKGRISAGLGFGVSLPLGSVTSVWSYGLSPLLTVFYDMSFDWGTVGLGIGAGASYLGKNPAIAYDYDTFFIPASAGVRYITNFGVPFFIAAEAYGGGTVLIVNYAAGSGLSQPIAMKPLMCGVLGCGYAFTDTFSVSVQGAFTTILMDSTVYCDVAPGIKVEYGF